MTYIITGNIISKNADIFISSCTLGENAGFSQALYKMIGKQDVTIYTSSTLTSALDAILKLKNYFAYPVIKEKNALSPVTKKYWDLIRVTDKSGTRVTKNNLIILGSGGMSTISQEYLVKLLTGFGINKYKY